MRGYDDKTNASLRNQIQSLSHKNEVQRKEYNRMIQHSERCNPGCLIKWLMLLTWAGVAAIGWLVSLLLLLDGLLQELI